MPWNGSGGKPAHVQSVVEDRAGRTWVGTYGGGLWLLEQGAFRQIPHDQTAGGNVIMLFEDSRGRVWINGGQGVAVYEGGVFRSYMQSPGAPSGAVRFAEDGRARFGQRATRVCSDLTTVASSKSSMAGSPSASHLLEGRQHRRVVDGDGA